MAEKSLYSSTTLGGTVGRLWLGHGRDPRQGRGWAVLGGYHGATAGSDLGRRSVFVCMIRVSSSQAHGRSICYTHTNGTCEDFIIVAVGFVMSDPIPELPFRRSRSPLRPMLRRSPRQAARAHWQGSCVNADIPSILNVANFNGPRGPVPGEYTLAYMAIGIGGQILPSPDDDPDDDTFVINSHVNVYFELENTLVTQNELQAWFPSFYFHHPNLSPSEARVFYRRMYPLFFERRRCPANDTE